MKRKLIATMTSCIIATVMLITSVLAYAETTGATKTNITSINYEGELQKIQHVLEKESNTRKSILPYMTAAIGEEDMSLTILDYKEAYARGDDAYEMLAANLKSTYEEVEVNGFTEEQAKALFVSAADLETGTAEMSEMIYSKEIPSFAPTHEIERKVGEQSTIDTGDREAKGATDRSTRTSYEKGGIGYEVKSLLGYNKSTSFLTVGDCNITAPKNKAGYMFYTIYYDNKYQDIGIAYFEGKWKAFVSGDWTGWGTGTVSIKQGDRLYFKLWIGADTRMYFQILDGNNFNNVIFQNNYSSENTIPSSGKGVGFNRQVTLVDTSHNPNSGWYLKNAIFDQSHLYNSNIAQTFQDSNTNKDRRGKFGCSWASDSKVSILANTHWHSEKISINM